MALVRLIVTALLLGSCVFLCLGFWLTESEWSRVVLGRYSVKWFLGALAANAVIILCTSVFLRALWRRRSTLSEDPPRLSPGRRFVFTAVVLLVTLVGVEVALRCLDFPPKRSPKPPGGSTRIFHPFLQHVDRIEHDGTYLRAYRGRLYERRSTAEFRVICLGGSTTWGHKLEPDETWPFMLEQGMRVASYDVEVINAGRPTYTTAHTVINYALQIRYYNPDVVIVLHGVNDLVRSFPRRGEPEFERDYGSYQGPMYRVLAGYNTDHTPTLGKWLRATRLCRLVCEGTAVDRMFYGSVRSKPQTPAYPPRADVQPEVDVPLGAFPSLRSYRENLQYLTRMCAADGCKVLLSTQAHVYGRPGAAEALAKVTSKAMRRTCFQTASGACITQGSLAAAMDALRQATLSIAEQTGVAVADPERAIDGNIKYFMDDFHVNPEGNAVIAESIAAALTPILDAVRAERSADTTGRTSLPGGVRTTETRP